MKILINFINNLTLFLLGINFFSCFEGKQETLKYIVAL